MVADTRCFHELDFSSVAEILSSSELHVDSELQVVEAATNWWKHDENERGKFLKSLLLKTRLHLLSKPTLSFLLTKMSSFSNNQDFAESIKRGLQNKKLKRRYCHQDEFDVVLCGGQDLCSRRSAHSGLYRLNVTGPKSGETLPKMNVARQFSEAFYIKGEVYVFGGFDTEWNQIMPVEKYSPVTNSWEVIARMYDCRAGFCTYPFIDSVYALGGFTMQMTNHCMKFNTASRRWSEISRAVEFRKEASSAVFEGRVVVCGGWGYAGLLNTVEAS